MAPDTIVHRFLKQAELRPNSPAYHVKKDGQWKPTSWRGYVTETKLAARALMTLGVGNRDDAAADGDPACVSIIGFNRPEWALMDFATMAVGGAPAGIYTTCSPSEVAYIVGHTESKVVLVENEAQWAKVAGARSELPKLEKIILMKGAKAIDCPMTLSWEAFLELANSTPESELQAHIDALTPARLATLIYTSGTTGPPKGVMLSHGNLAWTAQAAARIVETATASDSTLSYLPLSHIAEQMFSLHLPATIGAQVYFAEALEKVAENLREVQPTLLFGVPRIWEKMHEKVAAKLGAAKGLKLRLADVALATGREVNELLNRGAVPRGLLALKYRFWKRQFFDPAKAVMGLSRAKLCVSGGAPISADILRFFSGLDVVIHEVYGQSEDCGPTSFNLPGKTLFGSVGPVVRGVEVRLAEDREILVKGPNVFIGYHRDPAATADTLTDGWLHSGDLGHLDENGFLHITGRKKDLLITAGGKNIAPKNIEAALKLEPLIAEAVLIGDRRKFLSALLSLNPDAALDWAKMHGLEPANLHENATLRAHLQAHVDKVNVELARVEQVKKFTIVRRPFSIDAGELTPTMKVKRATVNEHYATDIEAMYAE